MPAAAESTALRERARTQREAARQSAERRGGAHPPRDRETHRAHAVRVERARGASALDRLRVAANLRLDRAIDLLREAARAGRAGESHDDAALRTQLAPLLIDLLACDALGEGFARVIDAAWFAFREEDARWTPDQLAALAAALQRSRWYRLRLDSAVLVDNRRGLGARQRWVRTDAP